MQALACPRCVPVISGTSQSDSAKFSIHITTYRTIRTHCHISEHVPSCLLLCTTCSQTWRLEKKQWSQGIHSIPQPMAVSWNDLERFRHLENPHLSVAHLEVPLGVQVPWMQNLIPIIHNEAMCACACQYGSIRILYGIG